MNKLSFEIKIVVIKNLPNVGAQSEPLMRVTHGVINHVKFHLTFCLPLSDPNKYLFLSIELQLVYCS